MGEWPLLPALRRGRASDADAGQVSSSRPLSVQRLPRAVHRHGRHAVRAQPSPLNKWLAATHLMMASKKGMSAMQVTACSASATNRPGSLPSHPRKPARHQLDTPLGGKDKVVEVDETYVGGKETNKHKSQAPTDGHAARRARSRSVALVERDGASARSTCRK